MRRTFGVPSSTQIHGQTSSVTLHLSLYIFPSVPLSPPSAEPEHPQLTPRNHSTPKALATVSDPAQPRHEQAHSKGACEQCESRLRVRLYLRILDSSLWRRIVTTLLCHRATRSLGHFRCGREGPLQEFVETGQHNKGEGTGGHSGTHLGGAGRGGPVGGMGACNMHMYILFV
jgi:hypothetical protein